MQEILHLNSRHCISAASLSTWREGQSGIAAELADFLAAWYSSTPTMRLHTSGSTGEPSALEVSREAMRASARLSCEFFGLGATSSALLCLPLRYIAGQMMVVRALVSGLQLHLQEPAGQLPPALPQLDFAPLVPFQAARTLAQPGGRKILSRIRTLLLGGGFVNYSLEEALQEHPGRVFASYGMTETLSHIALRELNGPRRSPFFTPLPGISVSLSPEGTLCLTAPHLGIEYLCTRDVAELQPDGRFRILGRLDAVINSGGIKIQAEDIERHIQAAAGVECLALPLPHPELGQCVALLWEGEQSQESSLLQAIRSLPRYHRPQHMQHARLPRTASGKPARAQALRLLNIDKLLPPML